MSAATTAVDLVIRAALHASADYVWLEPVANDSDRYTVSIEREGEALARATIESALGTAMIARLALICDIDLVAPTVRSGSMRVRTIDDERDLVFTVRPGTELRGELVFVRRTPRIASAQTVFVDGVLAPGDRVDRYRVLDALGAGGMGSVYRVEHSTLGRIYALKVLHAGVIERDARSRDRFLREARAAARIRNPHIVDVFDFGYLNDGRPYFVMELLPGESIARLLDRETPTPARAVAIASQLCDALAAAHEHGVIHADVTPSNVLLEETPQLKVKLVDFGLAKLRETAGESMLESSELVLGTPLYISPEQIRGRPADERSDQYSLGVVLFEMLVGAPPFLDQDLRGLCRKHLGEPVPAVVSPHGAIPTELVGIVERTLAKNPADRFTSMRALRAELDQVVHLIGRRGWRRWLA